MLRAFWKAASLGDRYLASALTYIGLGTMLWGLVPGPASVVASCSSEACGAGEKCCGGTCVPEDYVCCEDGSSGPGDRCFCCSDCTESTCTNPTSLQCPDPSVCDD